MKIYWLYLTMDCPAQLVGGLTFCTYLDVHVQPLRALYRNLVYEFCKFLNFVCLFAMWICVTMKFVELERAKFLAVNAES